VLTQCSVQVCVNVTIVVTWSVLAALSNFVLRNKNLLVISPGCLDSSYKFSINADR
jgi:hypothetical protein